MNLQQYKIRRFQKMIFSWWETHKRDLPWRYTHDPYKIMISEIMLQQTQVSRVLPKYQEFVRLFPTVGDLANAKPAQVLRLWKGMGYNRRALYLHQASRVIVKDFQGKYPTNEQELLRLPGVGTYTARAILVFAYKQDLSMVDTNIRNIIIHFFYQDVPQKESEIVQTAQTLVPHGESWEWHQALMDYGALELNRTGDRGLGTVNKQKPFKDSHRFYRGRIMDILREGEIDMQKLYDVFLQKYDKPSVYVDEVLDTLKKDKLVLQKNNQCLSLP
jgi:A/G-specific adenine glycosylase